MQFGSVCSGIEAATVAWHGLGWRAAWFAEIDKFASAVLAHHYPKVPNLGDMTKIARAILTGEVPAPDVLCGGTPCQAFSVAGLRESLDDARGNLTLKFVEIANAIDHVRVRRGEDECIVFWENVPGVLSTKDNAFGCFLAGLAGEDGALQPPGGKWSNSGAVYGPTRAVAWRTLDAQYFGVAQRRRRVFVVASARKGFDPAQVLFEWDGVRRDTAPRREARKTAPTIPARSTAGGGLGTDFDCDGGLLCVATGQAGAEIGAGMAPTLSCNNEAPIAAYGIRTANTSSNGWGVQEEATHTLDGAMGIAVAHSLRGEGFDASEDRTGRGTPLVPVAYATKLHNTSSNQAGKFYENYTASLDANSPPPAIVFDTTQITSAANRSSPKPGDPCHPLAAGAHAPAIAFQDRHRGDDGRGYDRAPPMSVDLVGALETVKPWNVVTPVAFPANLSGTQCASAEDLAPSMGAANPTAVAFQSSQSGVRIGNTHATLDANNGPRRHNGALVGMQVRRLTPEECEALQGFPRGYTAIPWRGKPADQCPDGPRYKALGNSWAVPVVRWIGERIAGLLN